ncbi:peptidoglycan-binding protein [Nodosilinea sp. LEGE 06152]|uniref:peptidoglycan-binding domain-containing protein n=1 Tax=Nodosilinea sp. LEGE 06152 TaxID=2777966 RepID=UPI00188306CF|nr:peptidoglycan-binding protein [Nodosilinea sp. LEGE 06152]MBE9155365.1 peptidoglycan-binding protein [Nodosilinea sp. LEGE 06152]
MVWNVFEALFSSPKSIPAAIAWENDLSIRPVLHSKRTPALLQQATYDLQSKLVAKGFLTRDQISGQFDQPTQLAVEAFQRSNGLKVDGVVGPLTWAALCYPTLALKTADEQDYSADVLRLQKILVKEGFQAEITGEFDRATDKALRRFQRYYGLRADGVCGPVTWTMMLGQRLVPQPNLWPWSRLSYQGERIAEQLLIIGAIWTGIVWNPLGIEQEELSLLAALVLAYGLTMVGPLTIEKILPNSLGYDHHPLLRYAPYVMVGLLWSPILNAVTAALS